MSDSVGRVAGSASPQPSGRGQPGSGSARRPGRSVAVAHRLSGHLEVVVEPLDDRRRRIERRHRRAHVAEPGVPFGRPDRERSVAHPQAGVPALGVVGGGSAPVLGEEQGQPTARIRESVVGLGIERTKDGIAGHGVIEPGDEGFEEGHPACGVEQRLLVAARRGRRRAVAGRQRAFCQDLPSVATDGA